MPARFLVVNSAPGPFKLKVDLCKDTESNNAIDELQNLGGDRYN